MLESLMQEVEQLFPSNAFLTVEEVTKLLKCSENVIYNWNKRPNPKRRPPRLMVGKQVRFPKKEFVRWLADELVLGRTS